MERYYIWINSDVYGWRQFGYTEGYSTIEELKIHNKFYFDENKEIKIFKSKEVSNG